MKKTQSIDWWKTLKRFVKTDHADVKPPLNKNGQIYTKETNKANILNTFFTAQNLGDGSQAILPQTCTLDSIIATPEEDRATL